MVEHQLIVHSYRDLLRAALRAVHFKTPNRYQVRHILRDSFRGVAHIDGRRRDAGPFVERKIKNTLAFLERARESAGVEHKVLNSILMTRWHREHKNKQRWPLGLNDNTDVARDLRRRCTLQFDATLEMLNRSEDLCLAV